MPTNRMRRALRGLLGDWRLTAAAALTLVVLLFGFAGLILHAEQERRDALDDRFAARASLTSAFARNFDSDLAERETIQAERLLAGPNVEKAEFDGLVAAFDFDAGGTRGDAAYLPQQPSRPNGVVAPDGAQA